MSSPALIAALWLTLAAPIAFADAVPASATGPELTGDVVERAARVWQWTLHTAFTPEQKAELRRELIAAWAVPAARPNILAVANFIDKLKGETPEQRELERESDRIVLLAFARQHRESRLTALLSNCYYARHPVLANGSIPLTDIETTATADMLIFLFREAGIPMDDEAQVRSRIVQGLVASYASQPPESQHDIHEMPRQWSRVRLQWSQAPEAERIAARAQWAQTFRSDANSGPGAVTAVAGAQNSPSGAQAVENASAHAFVNHAVSDSMSRTISMASHLYH